MTLYIKHLREICEKATPGPWTIKEFPDADIYGPFYEITIGEDDFSITDSRYYNSAPERIEDARFIAAFNPQTALALLDRLEKLEEENSNYRMQYRSHFFLLANARRICNSEMVRSANWVLAMELFAVGSTTARRICIDACIDADAKKVTKLEKAK